MIVIDSDSESEVCVCITDSDSNCEMYFKSKFKLQHNVLQPVYTAFHQGDVTTVVLVADSDEEVLKKLRYTLKDRNLRILTIEYRRTPR